MREVTLRVVAVASMPLFAVAVFAVVGALAGRSTVDRDGWQTRVLYVGFVSAFAAAFVAATGLDLSVAVEWWYPALALLGALAYRVDTRLWAWWSGEQIRGGGRSLAWLAPSLVAPVPEEVLYRAGLDVVSETVGPVGFVAVSAVLFGLAHLPRGRNEVVLKTIDGVLYATVYALTGSVVAPVLAHFGYNVAFAWFVSDRRRSTRGVGER